MKCLNQGCYLAEYSLCQEVQGEDALLLALLQPCRDQTKRVLSPSCSVSTPTKQITAARWQTREVLKC